MLVAISWLHVVAAWGQVEDSNNPWNEPRLGPSEKRQMSPEANTWLPEPAVTGNEISKFPPMDEDAALGIERTPYPTPDTATDLTSATVPSTDSAISKYAPAAGAYGQAPGNYGYGNNYRGYRPSYRSYPGNYGRYPGYRYRGYSPNDWGGFWPGSSGAFWPGRGGGFWPGGGGPFGNSGWTPFSDSWFW
jgi:hypothetical protein